jgi:hypothetical protein
MEWRHVMSGHCSRETSFIVHISGLVTPKALLNIERHLAMTRGFLEADEMEELQGSQRYAPNELPDLRVQADAGQADEGSLHPEVAGRDGGAGELLDDVQDVQQPEGRSNADGD